MFSAMAAEMASSPKIVLNAAKTRQFAAKYDKREESPQEPGWLWPARADETAVFRDFPELADNSGF